MVYEMHLVKLIELMFCLKVLQSGAALESGHKVPWRWATKRSDES
jgi:hypothetical protein